MDSFRKFLRSKIHRATVTEANLDYEGSLTIPPDLLAAADIAGVQALHLSNSDRRSRLDTDAIRGPLGSRGICVNGAAAHHAGSGDIVIIATFGFITDSQARSFKPKAIFVDHENRITEKRPEEPGRSTVQR